MDSDFSWDGLVPDCPLDTQQLLPLEKHAQSSTSSVTQHLDLLDLFFTNKSSDVNDSFVKAISHHDLRPNVNKTSTKITPVSRCPPTHEQLQNVSHMPQSPELRHPLSLSRCISPELSSFPPLESIETSPIMSPQPPHCNSPELASLHPLKSIERTLSQSPKILDMPFSTMTPALQFSTTTDQRSIQREPVTTDVESILADPALISPTAIAKAIDSIVTVPTKARSFTSAPIISPANEQISFQQAVGTAEAMQELSTRLESAMTETSALRKKVAYLISENRSLRGTLQHANKRLASMAHVSRTVNASSITSQSECKKQNAVNCLAPMLNYIIFLCGTLVGVSVWFANDLSETRLSTTSKPKFNQASVPTVPFSSTCNLSVTEYTRFIFTLSLLPLIIVMKHMKELNNGTIKNGDKKHGQASPRMRLSSCISQETNPIRSLKRIKKKNTSIFVDLGNFKKIS